MTNQLRTTPVNRCVKRWRRVVEAHWRHRVTVEQVVHESVVKGKPCQKWDAVRGLKDLCGHLYTINTRQERRDGYDVDSAEFKLMLFGAIDIDTRHRVCISLMGSDSAETYNVAAPPISDGVTTTVRLTKQWL